WNGPRTVETTACTHSLRLLPPHLVPTQTTSQTVFVCTTAWVVRSRRQKSSTSSDWPTSSWTFNCGSGLAFEWATSELLMA
ncbi:hypothetical protein AeNC1_008163, partial [Aphanomyces euteiches]